MSTRIACALDHFRFEQARLAPEALPALHGEGLCLWRLTAGYHIRLRSNASIIHEGPLRMVMLGASDTLHE
ncbi:hypothetical protein, partial [Klebsiella variicola]|uniref:hypothetical protein n=1 Tax=Klebsiella variicola TaxID=244366 RepID=UPI0034DE4425